MRLYKKLPTYIRHLIDQHVVDPEKIGAMGLSRGAFIASHIAALVPEIKHILGFAPLTRLANCARISRSRC